MNINIYYGGRGMIDDPTLFVIQKMQDVLEELRVRVIRYNLYELKNSIATLPGTLKDADGVILASTVEWHGIGGLMYQFLDACWLYADKAKISSTYMSPVVMSTTYGEREGKLDLSVAWELLGGLPAGGLCGYIQDIGRLERNKEYIKIIEKKAENLYRTINQQSKSFPASNQAIRQMISAPRDFSLTPQETEQLSVYNSDEIYVQQQKKDIAELADIYRGQLDYRSGKPKEKPDRDYIDTIIEHFQPLEGVYATYRIFLEGKEAPLIVSVAGNELSCYYGEVEKADVELHLSPDTMKDIVGGARTFQHTFMAGGMKKKGDFKLMRLLDQLFVFQQ